MGQGLPAGQSDAAVQQATTVLMVDLLIGTRVYCDTFRDAPPILVIDTGPTELQLSAPAGAVTVEDLAVIDTVLQAAAEYRTAVLTRLGMDVP
jgi:hypothetical protein